MKKMFFSLLTVCALLLATAASASAGPCVKTDYAGLTAALVNPGTVGGTVDATGCDIGVYYNTGRGKVQDAQIYGARYYGVFVNGDKRLVSVDVLDSWIHNIGDVPFNGTQRGVGVYYRGFLAAGGTRGTISGNTIERYQKGGIVTNGVNTRVQVMDNVVTGLGPVRFIAQNGIQIGYGAQASVMRNTVSENSYTGTSTVSGGIVVVGGPGYGTCPEGTACAYTTGTQIVQNTVRNNDIGIFLTNLLTWYGTPADVPTNVKAVNNTVSSNALNNRYYGVGYQAGIADQGDNDKIITNTVSGNGYDPAVYPFAWVYGIDADVSFTNRPKVHANR